MGAFAKAVRDGIVPNLKIDADSPWIDREDVPLDASPGTRIKFHGEGGYDNGAFARVSLVVGEVYALKSMDVGDWESFVEVEEVSGRFNSVHFELVQ